MIKVKEWLDKNLFPAEWNESPVLKDNGHFEVHGSWIYPKDWHGISKKDSEGWTSEEWIERLKHPPDHMFININNETMIVGNMCVNGKWSIYNYIQTYEHIPRGEPDVNGYYARSTDEEAIRYLDEYLQQIKNNENDNY
jgi:hypothetical protein